MSENDPRAFEEYTTHKTSWQLRIPVQICAHALYKYLVDENNGGKNLIHIKDYARLTVAFAKEHPEFFHGKAAQEMLKELEELNIEFQSQDQPQPKENPTVKVDNFVKPSSLQMLNTKLSNFLFDKNKDLTTEMVALVVSGENENKIAVKTQLSFVPLDLAGVKVPSYLNAYDRAVHDAVCSIFANGNMQMTSNQIYEAMTGKSTKSQIILRKVDNSVRRLMMSLVYADYTIQAQSKGLDCKKAVVNSNILYCQGITITFPNGEVVTGWELIKPPALYQYATEMEQIITVDKAVLLAPNITNTDDVIVMKHYILRRIEAMKNNSNHMDSRKILFSTIFSNCDINETTRRKSQRKREDVIEILKGLKSIGYIKDFTEYKGQKNKILGVEIVLDKPKKKKLMH